MPVVQQYGNANVERKIVRGPRLQQVQRDAFGVSDNSGAQLLNSFANTLNDVQVRFEQERKEADRTAAEEALLNFEKDKNNLFFNPDNGYFNKSGRDAYDSSSSISQELEKLKKTHSDLLQSEQAKSAFEKVVDQHIVRANTDVLRHASKNLKAWQTSTIQSQIENSLENAVNYWANPEELRVQNALGRQSVLESARLQGLGPESLNEQLQNYDSSFAKAIVNSALTSSSNDAQAAFDKWGGMLEPQDRLNIGLKIEKKKKSESEASKSSMAVLLGNNLVNDNIDFDDAKSRILSAVENIQDGDLQKSVRDEAMKQLKLRQDGEKEERTNIYEAAESFLLEQGTIDQFIAQHGDDWAKLSAKERKQLRTGAKVETDWTKLNEFVMQPDAVLAESHPNDTLSFVAPQHRGRVISAIQAAKRGQRGTEGRRSQLRTNTIKQIFGDDKNDWDLNAVNKFNSLIAEEETFRESQKGSDLDFVEYEQLLSDMTIKAVKQRDFWFDSESTLKDIEPEDYRSYSQLLRKIGKPVTSEEIINAANLYNSISEEHLTQITEFLESSGAVVSKDNVLQVYLNGLQ